MLARQAVLLAPSKSSHPTQLLSRQHFVRVSPLAATLTKNAGGGLRGGLLIMVNHLVRDKPPFVRRSIQVLCSHTVAHSFALSCSFLHSAKTQPSYFQAIPHSFTKTRGVREGASAL